MDVADQVLTNLVHYNLWTGVAKHNARVPLLSGTPPKKLHELDAADQVEWVVPITMEQQLCSMDDIELWFAAVAELAGRPKRLSLGLLNDDGTVVYYFVHDGVVKPRQN